MDIKIDQNLGPEFKDKVLSTDSVRRVMNLYYLVDTSGSMVNNGKMESVNQVMPEVIELVADISNSNVDTAEIKVACLTFSTGAHWMYSAPISANDFKWTNCTPAGLTDLGQAYEELEKHLHRDNDLGNNQGHFAPAVILLTDGMPNDDHKGGLEILKKNNWFKHATKVAIAIGTDTKSQVLRDFVGENAAEEAIIRVHDVQTLKDIIRLVSCSVSKVGTSNVSTENKAKENMLGEEIKGELSTHETKQVDGAIDVAPVGDDLFN